MSESLGNIEYVSEQQSYLGPQGGQFNAGPEARKQIDTEVRKLVDEGYERAKAILTEKADDLERLALGLLEYETLTGAEITKVIAGEALNRGGDADDTPTGGSSASVTAIPKTKKPKPPKDTGMEPEPSA
jgi:cell division protease FtsH